MYYLGHNCSVFNNSWTFKKLSVNDRNSLKCPKHDQVNEWYSWIKFEREVRIFETIRPIYLCPGANFSLNKSTRDASKQLEEDFIADVQ